MISQRAAHSGAGERARRCRTRTGHGARRAGAICVAAEVLGAVGMPLRASDRRSTRERACVWGRWPLVASVGSVLMMAPPREGGPASR